MGPLHDLRLVSTFLDQTLLIISDQNLEKDIPRIGSVERSIGLMVPAAVFVDACVPKDVSTYQ